MPASCSCFAHEHGRKSTPPPTCPSSYEYSRENARAGGATSHQSHRSQSANAPRSLRPYMTGSSYINTNKKKSSKFLETSSLFHLVFCLHLVNRPPSSYSCHLEKHEEKYRQIIHCLRSIPTSPEVQRPRRRTSTLCRRPPGYRE